MTFVGVFLFATTQRVEAYRMALRNDSIAGGAGLLGLLGTGPTAANYAAGEVPLFVWLMGAGSPALVVLWLALDRARIQGFLRARSTQQSGFAVVLVGVAAVLVVGANILAKKHDVRWDLTSSERYSISPQTISVLEGLTVPVEVRAYFGGESIEKSTFIDLIEGYQVHTTQPSLRPDRPSAWNCSGRPGWRRLSAWNHHPRRGREDPAA